MDIISKRAGLRREDLKARALIDKNRGTIEKLADQISNGAYSASRRRQAGKPEPQASGLILSDMKSARTSEVPRPYIRISPNHRVVVVDDATSRQMHFLGEIRRVGPNVCFVLALKRNGFFSELETELAARLGPLDGAVMDGARTDASLAAEISAALGYDRG